ncbi:alpha/beta fold hydrolase [Beijerinckia sp. L45]|uniref:alpha/beta fold hydrolase n=1 Tax=Beijerinckia sp. L45 TaxID=1641855 RepID=UPI00131C2ECD|nr:alpha/beta fold hydrolase [Beijerinckia sp. L45]
MAHHAPFVRAILGAWTLAFVAVEDSEFYYEISGEGPPVVLVTGLAGVASYWEPNIAELRKHFTVLRYDHRGTGKSVRSERDYSIEMLADDLLGLMDAVGFERASLIGHSTGGAIGQVLAARYPERIDRLVLYGTWATLCPQMRLCMELRLNLLDAYGVAKYHEASPIFLYPPRFVSDQWDRIARDLVAAVANSTTPSILKARVAAVVDFDGSSYLPDIESTTLILVAQDDILTPAGCSEELARGIPHATLKVLSDGAHAVSHCDPKTFNDTVIAFLTV